MCRCSCGQEVSVGLCCTAHNFGVMFDSVPVVDAGVPPLVRPPCPSLHIVDVAGVRVVEVSNTNA